jgi:hypothetical protein
MAIMNTCTLRILTVAIMAAASSSVFADELQNATILKIERPIMLRSSHSAGQRLESGSGVALDSGKTTIVLSLSATETISAVSFVNSGAKGRITVSASSVNLATNSPRWQQVTSDLLADGTVKSLVRPNDARYLKVTFEVTQPGQISRLGVYATSTVASRHAKHYALLAADSTNAVESDGKAIADGKDLGEGKDIPAEEAPAEGPPPGLPDPPPFVFVPVLVPTSP